MSKKEKSIYICQDCGQTEAKWLGRCPGCGGWNTLVEEVVAGDLSRKGRSLAPSTAPQPLKDVHADSGEQRIPTTLNEADRVLGGGIVPGSLVLLAGEPGIGKSTILMQILMGLASKGQKVLYISGEESLEQIRLRAERLGPIPDLLMVASETDVEAIIAMIGNYSPDVLAVDSVQTLYHSNISSAPGSVAQVREGAARLMGAGKSAGLPIILVGHVTKEGALAGPRVLEHLVDAVLYLEGDRTHSFRLLRTVKNRFGPTHEVGVFEMTSTGLKEIDNPSELFMSQSSTGMPGSVTVVCVEGTRPILVEVQALVTPSYLGTPRRTVTGFDSNRLALLVAVCERYLNASFYNKDIFLNIAGGMRLSEPAADLGVVAALYSSLRKIAMPSGCAVFGEVGLTGEIRPVGRTKLRLEEAWRLGFKRCVVPAANIEKEGLPDTYKKQLLPINKLPQFEDIF